YTRWVRRAFRVTAHGPTNQTVAALEATFLGRLFVERIKRDEHILDAEPAMIMREGDVIAVARRRDTVSAHDLVIGTEVDDRDVLHVPELSLNVVLANKVIAGKTLQQLREEYAEQGRGVYLQQLVRQGEEMPLTMATAV